MKDEDLAYYRQRAARERELAREARHPNAARAHNLLAGYYADLVGDDAAQPFGGTRAGLKLFTGSR